MELEAAEERHAILFGATKGFARLTIAVLGVFAVVALIAPVVYLSDDAGIEAYLAVYAAIIAALWGLTALLRKSEWFKTTQPPSFNRLATSVDTLLGKDG